MHRFPRHLIGWLLLLYALLNAVVADFALAYGIRAAREGWPLASIAQLGEPLYLSHRPQHSLRTTSSAQATTLRGDLQDEIGVESPHDPVQHWRSREW